MFNTQSGGSFDDIIGDPSITDPTLKEDNNADAAAGSFDAIPGAYQSSQVGTSNATGTQSTGGDTSITTQKTTLPGGILLVLPNLVRFLVLVLQRFNYS